MPHEDIIIPVSYRPEEAAKVLGVSRGTIYKAMNQGVLPTFTVLGCRLISRRAIEQFIADNEKTGPLAA
ncbi:MAG: helix-turn-helix domain-containing protein [Chromatiales bacterium]|nr:helix-turn-helix domain-containing protein [Chromatiales bacterium]